MSALPLQQLYGHHPIVPTWTNYTSSTDLSRATTWAGTFYKGQVVFKGSYVVGTDPLNADNRGYNQAGFPAITNTINAYGSVVAGSETTVHGASLFTSDVSLPNAPTGWQVWNMAGWVVATIAGNKHLSFILNDPATAQNFSVRLAPALYPGFRAALYRHNGRERIKYADTAMQRVGYASPTAGAYRSEAFTADAPPDGTYDLIFYYADEALHWSEIDKGTPTSGAIVNGTITATGSQIGVPNNRRLPHVKVERVLTHPL